MFSNLDNFLNGQDICKQQMNNLTDASLSDNVVNDSFDLDLSDPTLCQKSKSKDIDDEVKGAKFVPGKGQKLAAKRLKKITETLETNLGAATRQKNQMEKKATKPKSSPKKKTARGGRVGRRGRANIYYNSSNDDSSDLEVDQPPVSSSHALCRSNDPNVIVLDCDDEYFTGPAVNFTRNIATASAVSVEESMDLKVSVRINGKIEQYQMSPFQKLSVLIAQISNKKDVPLNHIALMFKEKTVSENDTPSSIGYIQGLVLKAHISDMVHINKPMTNTVASTNSNKLEIKIQSDGRKRPFVTYIGATEQLITLAFACAEEFKCEVDKVAIEFDGEFINFKETAEDLALEGGEVMDFFMKK